MSIEGIKLGLQSLQSIQKPLEKPKSEGAGGVNSFGDMLSEAVKDLNRMQVEADKQIEGVLLDKQGVSVHDAMIALEKADVAFQLMSTIHNKIVRAYEEIIRTQI